MYTKLFGVLGNHMANKEVASCVIEIRCWSNKVTIFLP